jgi:copper chaperone CopZ
MNPTHLDIDGMTCQGCVRSVRAALAAVPGVTDVEVDLTSARVRGGLPDDLLQALDDAGYVARLNHSAASSAAQNPTNQSPSQL